MTPPAAEAGATAEVQQMPSACKTVSWIPSVVASDDDEKAPKARRHSLMSDASDQSSSESSSMMMSRISSKKSEYDDQVQAVLTLDSRTLLRAVPISKVLRCFGQIWASSEGTEEDYLLSMPVAHIDHFLSHAWATPRLSKVIALMIYYNFLPGLMIAGATCTLAFLAKAIGLLPIGNMEDVYFIGGEAAWLLALFFLHETYCLLGPSVEPVVFLDKVCIHQTDPEIKAKGIKGLPAFLKDSHSMLILYSDAYLTRLWTVYELATYLLLKSNGRVEFIPVDLPQLPMIGLVIVSFLPSNSFGKFWWVAELIGFFLVALLCRWLAALHKTVCEAFVNFDMFETKCYFEGDRRVVEGNVEAYMKHMGHIHVDATQMESLDAFTRLVRTTVPDLLKASLGAIGIPYRITIMVDIPGIVQVFDLLWASFWTDTLTAQFVDFLLTIGHWLLIGPIALAAGICVAKAFVEKQGMVAMVLILGAILLTVFMVEWALAVPFFILAFLAQHHPIVAALGWAAYCGCLLSLLFLVYGLPELLRGLIWGGPNHEPGGTLTSDFNGGDFDSADNSLDFDAPSSPGTSTALLNP